VLVESLCSTAPLTYRSSIKTFPIQIRKLFLTLFLFGVLIGGCTKIEDAGKYVKYLKKAAEITFLLPF